MGDESITNDLRLNFRCSKPISVNCRKPRRTRTGMSPTSERTGAVANLVAPLWCRICRSGLHDRLRNSVQLVQFCRTQPPTAWIADHVWRTAHGVCLLFWGEPTSSIHGIWPPDRRLPFLGARHPALSALEQRSLVQWPESGEKTWRLTFAGLPQD